MSDASDILVERLLAWGVDTIFGLPGVRGEPNRMKIALTNAHDKVRELV